MTETTRGATVSIFITVLAWILISFTGLGAAGGLLQTVAVNIMLSVPDPKFQADAAGALFPLRILPAALFLFSTFALICAVGLLKRRDWARRCVVGLFAIGIAFHAVALVLFLVGVLLHPPAAPDGDVRFAQMLRLMMIPMSIGALGVAVLFGWLIKRRLSPDVRREFRGGVAT